MRTEEEIQQEVKNIKNELIEYISDVNNSKDIKLFLEVIHATINVIKKLEWVLYETKEVTND